VITSSSRDLSAASAGGSACRVEKALETGGSGGRRRERPKADKKLQIMNGAA